MALISQHSSQHTWKYSPHGRMLYGITDSLFDLMTLLIHRVQHVVVIDVYTTLPSSSSDSFSIRRSKYCVCY